MALDSDLKKMAIIEWCNITEPGLPLSPGTLGQEDQQILLWGNPDVLWSTLTIVSGGHIGNDLRLLYRHKR